MGTWVQVGAPTDSWTLVGILRGAWLQTWNLPMPQGSIGFRNRRHIAVGFDSGGYNPWTLVTAPTDTWTIVSKPTDTGP